MDLLVGDLGKKKVEEAEEIEVEVEVGDAEVMDGISSSEIARFSHQVGGGVGGGQVAGGEQVFDNKIKSTGIRSANPKVFDTPRSKRSLDKMEVESKEEALVEVRQETSYLEEKMLYEEHSDHDKSLILEKITPENLEDDTKEVLEEESVMASRDGRPAPRGTLPAGKGGFPAPPRPVKMIKTAGKLRGKIKARISTFSKRGNK